MSRVYLDYAATTALDPRVHAEMERCQNLLGNPNSIHAEGRLVRKEIDTARRMIAEDCSRDTQSIICTPSATAGNNLVLQGVVRRFKKLYPNIQPEIIISPLEHASVYETARALEAHNEISLFVLPINDFGQVSISDLEKQLSQKTALVSVQWVNNETGIVQPISEIVACIQAFRTRTQSIYPYIHTDAVQGVGHYSCDAIRDVDFFTVSAHKISGPTGVGIVGIPSNALFDPIIFGGGQEYGWWSGTESVDRIVGFAHAFHYATQNQLQHHIHTQKFQKYFIEKIHHNTHIQVHTTCWQSVAPHIISLRVSGIERPDIVLDMRDIAVSSGSACSVGSIVPSRILSALGFSNQIIQETIRISFGNQTTRYDIDRCVDVLEDITKQKRS